MNAGQKPRCGLLGPGVRRLGLGPFLARDLEAAGCTVAAVCGRDAARTQTAAAELAGRFGHPVAAHVSTEEMLAEHGLDALVIAAPIEAHAPALRAALAASGGAGVATLCEKPLVAPEEGAEVPGLVEAFASRGRLLMENCQWPYVLPALWELHPGLADQPVAELEMRLSPSGRGRAMLVDSLSHYLSVLQGVVPVDATTRLGGVEIHGAASATERLEVALTLESPFPRLRSTLYLERCEAQPRPAWIAVNGRRGDRQIRTSDYSMSLESGGRAVRLSDPLTALVRDFVDILREPDLDRVRAEAHNVTERARLYGGILDAWAE